MRAAGASGAGDLEEVPEDLRRQLSFIVVDDAEDVLRHALTPTAADARPAAR